MPSDPTTKDLIAAAREQADLHLTTTRRLLTALADRLETTEEECDKQVGVIRKLRTRLEEAEGERENYRSLLEAVRRSLAPDGKVQRHGIDSPLCGRLVAWISRELRAYSPEPSDPEPEDPGIALVKHVVAEMLGKDPKRVSMSDRFRDDLGADDLNAVEIVMGLEEEFGVDVPDEICGWWKTVGDAVAYLREYAPERFHGPDTSDVPNRAESVDPEPNHITDTTNLAEDPEPEDDPWEAIERRATAGVVYEPYPCALLDLRKRVEKNDDRAYRAMRGIDRRMDGLERGVKTGITLAEGAGVGLMELSDRVKKLESHADRGSEAEAELRARIAKVEHRTTFALRLRGLAERVEALEAKGGDHG